MSYNYNLFMYIIGCKMCYKTFAKHYTSINTLEF